jgi:metal-sulfur cluster biosynthetic enzyme
MTAVDNLAELVNNPEVRDLLFGLSERDEADARVRVSRVVMQLTAEACGADGVISEQVVIRPISTEQVRAAVGEDAIIELARYMDQTPDETAEQLAVVLPDVLDAVARTGQRIEPDELHRAVRFALASGADTSGPFAS